jgi:hypothetical protein
MFYEHCDFDCRTVYMMPFGSAKAFKIESFSLSKTTRNGEAMLLGVAVVLLILWIVGLVGVYTIGAMVHLFLILAIISVVFHFLRGRKAT